MSEVWQAVYLVMEETVWIDDHYIRPVMVFRDVEAAERCARIRQERAEAMACELDGRTKCFIKTILLR